MMIAYNLRRKDYTNSLCRARLGLKHPAGFTLKKRITTRSRSGKERGKQKEDEEEQNSEK